MKRINRIAFKPELRVISCNSFTDGGGRAWSPAALLFRGPVITATGIVIDYAVAATILLKALIALIFFFTNTSSCIFKTMPFNKSDVLSI